MGEIGDLTHFTSITDRQMKFLILKTEENPLLYSCFIFWDLKHELDGGNGTNGGETIVGWAVFAHSSVIFIW